jgi:small subunit ribosomal protein S16
MVGKRNRPVYRVVVAEKRSKRDGQFIDLLGTYDPNVKPPVLRLNREKLAAWQKKGALVSAGLYRLLTEKKEKAV